MEEDRAYALAWQAEKNAEHGCGQPVDECMKIENSFAYAYEPVRCHALAARGEAEAAYREAHKETHGVMFRLTRTPHGPIG